MFLVNNFALSEAENHNSSLLNRGGIADLTLLRTLFAILQKSRELSFWKVIEHFVLLTYASLATSRTLLQQLLDSRYDCNDNLNLMGSQKSKLQDYN